MEIEKRPAEKFWKIVRIVFHMVRKNVCKRKVIVDEAIHLVMRRGKIAGKAILLHHHVSCRSDDINESFDSPRDYEFSCSNTPAANYASKYTKDQNYQTEQLKIIRRVLEVSPLPEFGEQHQVDKDAEEFIKKFYKDLKNQKRIAATVGSPSPYHQFISYS